TMRLFHLSATKICPAALTKMPAGPPNWLVPLPLAPNVVQPVPVISLKRAMRSLQPEGGGEHPPPSATKICPAELTKIPHGWMNWLIPAPPLPNVVQPVPDMSLVRAMRLLPVSSAKICPAGGSVTKPAPVQATIRVAASPTPRPWAIRRPHMPDATSLKVDTRLDPSGREHSFELVRTNPQNQRERRKLQKPLKLSVSVVGRL